MTKPLAATSLEQKEREYKIGEPQYAKFFHGAKQAVTREQYYAPPIYVQMRELVAI